MTIGELAILFLLLAANALFVLSELAVVSSSKPLLRQRARAGDKSAAKALALAENPGRFLSTVQVGITLLGIITGAYSGAALAEPLGKVLDTIPYIAGHGHVAAVVLAVSGVTFLTVVVAELVPKQLALSHPEKFAMLTAGTMNALALAAAPFVKLLEISSLLILRLMGHKRRAPGHVTETVIRAVIAEGAESGAIEVREHELMRRIIQFGDRHVESLMTHRMDVTFIDVSDTPAEIHKKVHESGHSHYPVIDGEPDAVLGVIHVKDLIGRPDGRPPGVIRERVSPATVLATSVTGLKALELFKRSDTHMAIIIDEYGTTQGIVTAFDLLEAIVGELASNIEPGEEPQILKREDGSYLVDGLTPVDEVHLEIGVEGFDRNADYQTIGGFIIDELGRTPKTGDVLERFGYRFEVVDLDGRRIDKIIISHTHPELPLFS